MTVPPIVTAILQLAHVFGGVIWIGFALYQFLVVSRVNVGMQAAAVNYQLGIAKYTSFGQIMAAASIVTTIAGLALWGTGAHRQSEIGLAILSLGSLTGLAAFGHGFGIDKRYKEFVAAVKGAEVNGQVDPAKYSILTPLMQRLDRTANISMALLVVTLICMTTYDVF